MLRTITTGALALLTLSAPPAVLAWSDDDLHVHNAQWSNHMPPLAPSRFGKLDVQPALAGKKRKRRVQLAVKAKVVRNATRHK
ncbi:MAG: hypothetical protein KGL39_19000 [Patescibacteria group bacterium]|nr:hypothetical protein [Patescibacteria group bacterium]